MGWGEGGGWEIHVELLVMCNYCVRFVGNQKVSMVLSSFVLYFLNIHIPKLPINMTTYPGPPA